MMNKRPTRDVNVTILIVFVLCFTFWYGLRIYSSLVNWQILLEFGANPVYILATGLLWFLTGLGLLILLWKKHVRTIRAGLLAAVLYISWYWLDRLIIQVSPEPNVLFSAVFSSVLLVIYSFILITSAS